MGADGAFVLIIRRGEESVVERQRFSSWTPLPFMLHDGRVCCAVYDEPEACQCVRGEDEGLVRLMNP